MICVLSWSKSGLAACWSTRTQSPNSATSSVSPKTERCRSLRPYVETLVDGFGTPEQLRYAEMLHPENIPDDSD